jgi:transcriptional regulator with XRE-family HTH domain
MRNKKFREVLGEVLREYRVEQNLTLRALAKEASVALGYVSEIERGHKEASSEVLSQLAFGLKIPLYQIVVEAGYRLQEWDTPTEIFVDKLDKELSGV